MDLANILWATDATTKTCGCASLWEIRGLVSFVWSIISIIQFGIPIILIILGMLDLGKAVAAGEEKEIKEAQKLLGKRAISAIAVFFVIAIVQLALRLLPSSAGSGLNVAVCGTKDILPPTQANINKCKASTININLDQYKITEEEAK